MVSGFGVKGFGFQSNLNHHKNQLTLIVFSCGRPDSESCTATALLPHVT